MSDGPMEFTDGMIVEEDEYEFPKLQEHIERVLYDSIKMGND